jgi:hypothetical protein
VKRVGEDFYEFMSVPANSAQIGEEISAAE